jgi:hypothetical protein
MNTLPDSLQVMLEGSQIIDTYNSRDLPAQ